MTPRSPADAQAGGPLAGLRVVEMAAIGPVPFGVMMLADMGADVVRVDRADAARAAEPAPVLGRGRRSVALDLKDPEALAACRGLIDGADILVEGFRPGVMERLGLGPDECLARNEGLVYARMTGWGQTGPLASTAGHDIDYIALAGALGAIGTPDTPIVPLNLVGDYGGGGMLLVVGVLLALVERSRSGRGQVVDAAMVDGAATLMTVFHEMAQLDMWNSATRQSNTLDGGAPYYRVYRTADDRHMAVGPLEPKFYAALVQNLEVSVDLGSQEDRSSWPLTGQTLATAFRTRTQREWTERFDGTDACVFPVLSLDEARVHPAAVARAAYSECGGISVPSPAPRLGRTPGNVAPSGSGPGGDTVEILRAAGLTPDQVDRLLRSGGAAVGSGGTGEDHRAHTE
jgi:alpha-methylacyl-CoA racemase